MYVLLYMLSHASTNNIDAETSFSQKGSLPDLTVAPRKNHSLPLFCVSYRASGELTQMPGRGLYECWSCQITEQEMVHMPKTHADSSDTDVAPAPRLLSTPPRPLAPLPPPSLPPPQCPVLSLATVRPDARTTTWCMGGWFSQSSSLRALVPTKPQGKEPKPFLGCCPLCRLSPSRHTAVSVFRSSPH